MSLPPNSPTSLSGVAGNQSIYIIFTAGADNGNSINNYQYSTDGGSNFTAFSPAQTTSPVMITGLTNGTSYSVQIKAVNIIGASAASSTVVVTPTSTSLLSTNLLIELDTNNSSSYSGSGTSWTNLRSSGSYSATLIGSPTYNTTDSSNKYFKFNSSGSGQYAQISQASAINPAINTPFTIQIWAKINNIGTAGGLFQKLFGAPSYDGYSVDYNANGGLRIHENGNSQVYFWDTGANLINNQWTLYTANIQFGSGGSRTNKLFINGRQVLTQTSNDIGINSPTAPLQIALGINGYGNLDVGAFYYYNSELTTTQIIQNYDSTKSRYFAVAPSTPTGLTSSGITDISHNLTWNASSGATTYIIQRASDISFNNIIQTYSGINSTSQTVTDLSSGINYYYRIAAVNSNGTSSYSPGINVLTIAAPPSPTINNLTYNSFRLSWLSKTGANYYNILVSTDINFLNIIRDVSVNDVSYNIIGLNDYTNYYYKISSSNTTGNSNYSNTQIIKTHLYTGITDISDNLNSLTDLTNFLLNNLENVFDANQFKTYLRENKNNFISQIANVTVADISGILSQQLGVNGLENVKFIVFDDNETIEISGNILNELRNGDILYLSGFDGDVINLLINSNNYTLILSSTGVIYNSILYELGNNFRLGNDIEFIVKLLGSGGLEGNGIGDPFINPVFGDKYYLPNDEETYLLFDNNDNLKIYTKTWFAPLITKNKMSYMRYIIIDYNSKIFGIDLESMDYVKMSNKIDLDKMRLPRFKDDIKKYTNLKMIDGQSKISNYDGKKYKISRYNKKREIIFDCTEYKVILKLISDLAYEDIRNNVNIIFSGNINIDKLKKFRGAIISEAKLKKIDCSKLFFSKSLYY
jgi:hypothetical protein